MESVITVSNKKFKHFIWSLESMCFRFCFVNKDCTSSFENDFRLNRPIVCSLTDVNSLKYKNIFFKDLKCMT